MDFMTKFKKTLLWVFVLAGVGGFAALPASAYYDADDFDTINCSNAIDPGEVRFSQPPRGTVGLYEEEARAKGGEVVIYKSTFKPMRHTLSGRDEKTLMKLIVDKTTDVVLGAHMVGPDAAEIIQGIGIAVRMGATKAQFDQTVAVHPSAAEEFVTMRFPVGD